MSTVYHTSCRTCGVKLTPENHILSNGKPRPHCQTCQNARQRAWRAANPEKYQAYDRAHYAKNVELHRIRATQKRREQGIPLAYYIPEEDTRSYWQRYRAKYPERVAEARDRCRARTLNGSMHDPVDYEAILDRDGLICCICYAPIDPTLPRKSSGGLIFDHDIPLARNGPHVMENIHPAHFKCNDRKNAKTVAELTPHHRRGL